jgi:hypothetical protein
MAHGTVDRLDGRESPVPTKKTLYFPAVLAFKSLR